MDIGGGIQNWQVRSMRCGWNKSPHPNGRERTVLISADEYQQLKRRDRQVLTLSDFTDADIAAVKATRAPESPKAFDHDLQQ